MYLIASALGPLLTIVMFVIHGNEWRLVDLRNVFLAGLGLELLCVPFLFWYRDSATLTNKKPRKKEGAGGAGGVDGAEGGADGSEGAEGADGSRTPPAVAKSTEGVSRRHSGGEGASRTVERGWVIPWITFISSLCFALGSGMTVKARRCRRRRRCCFGADAPFVFRASFSRSSSVARAACRPSA